MNGDAMRNSRRKSVVKVVDAAEMKMLRGVS